MKFKLYPFIECQRLILKADRRQKWNVEMLPNPISYFAMAHSSAGCDVIAWMIQVSMVRKAFPGHQTMWHFFGFWALGGVDNRLFELRVRSTQDLLFGLRRRTTHPKGLSVALLQPMYACVSFSGVLYFARASPFRAWLSVETNQTRAARDRTCSCLFLFCWASDPASGVPARWKWSLRRLASSRTPQPSPLHCDAKWWRFFSCRVSTSTFSGNKKVHLYWHFIDREHQLAYCLFVALLFYSFCTAACHVCFNQKIHQKMLPNFERWIKITDKLQSVLFRDKLGNANSSMKLVCIGARMKSPTFNYT